MLSFQSKSVRGQPTPDSRKQPEGTMLDRIIGVLRLDAVTYEEIEADESATTQAAMVVAIVAIVGGIVGAGIGSALGVNFVGSFLRQLIGAFVAWLVWAAVTYFVGTLLFNGKSTMGQMLRVLGFAQAPGFLFIIPVCGTFVGWLWTLACSFIAIRQGLDLDNTKAFFTAVVALILVIVINIVIGRILGVLGFEVSVIQGIV
jgi:hypothetical protein